MLLISQNLKRVLNIFFWWTLDFVYYNSSRIFLFEIWFLTSLKEIIIFMLHQRNTVRKYIFQKKKKKKSKKSMELKLREMHFHSSQMLMLKKHAFF